MQKTSIEWTDFTANPLKYRDDKGNVVWGCVHKSAGCAHCYAEALAKRYGRGDAFTAENMKKLTPFLDEKELRKMLGYKPASGKRCFVGDMTDLFGEWVPFELLDRLFAVFALRQDVTWQVLTKRPERMQEYIQRLEEKARTFGGIRGASAFGVYAYAEKIDSNFRGGKFAGLLNEQFMKVQDALHFGIWPLPFVWLGVSVENQDTLHRIDTLKDIPAAIRFVSFEPLLEDLGALILDRIHWAIVGGESGPGARPMHPEWARSVRDYCQSAGVATFFKQWGEWAPASQVAASRAITHAMTSTGDVAEFNREAMIAANRDARAWEGLRRVGKKAAGALLDGREWREFPEVRA